MAQETVTIEDKDYFIECRDTKIGDVVYDKNSKTTYVASISDADDLNWIVVEQINHSTI